MGCVNPHAFRLNLELIIIKLGVGGEGSKEEKAKRTSCLRGLGRLGGLQPARGENGRLHRKRKNVSKTDKNRHEQGGNRFRRFMVTAFSS